MGFGDSFADVELNPNKLITHADKLRALAEGGDVFPVTVELDLVDYCNHNCGWCVDPVHGKNSMEHSTVSRLLSEFNDLGIEGIVFKGGGEPTLHESFPEVIEEARTFGFEVGIVSNGSRLEKLYDAVVKNASYLRVSIDGPTPESHRSVHQSKDFKDVIEGTKKTVELRKRLQQRHPIIGLSFAMDHSLIDFIGEAVSLGDRLGVEYVMFRPPFFEEVGRENTMTIQQKKALVSAFERERDSYNGEMKVFVDYWISDSEPAEFFSRGESPRRGKFMQEGANGIEHITKRCLASPLLAVVAADGKVYPCCNLRFLDEWNIGTVNYDKGITFKDIWGGDKRKEKMKQIHEIECIKVCTHPMSRYNEVIEYLKSPQHHRGFV